MSNSSPNKSEKIESSNAALPPVEVPTAGFILQLFVIPAVIVAIIAVVWLLFSWLAHMGSSPEGSIRDLEAGRGNAWQTAYNLANELGQSGNENIKRNGNIARRLAILLDSHVQSGENHADDRRLRMFLCRALGEFYVADGLPALIRAARSERFVEDVDVRRTALEGLAVLAHNLGPETLIGNPDLMLALKEASSERSEIQNQQASRAQLRATSAFTLGVLGGQEALDRLVNLQQDASPNVRFNATTGLARHGDGRCIDGLQSMLQSSLDSAAATNHNNLDTQFQQTTVLRTALRAIQQLSRSNSKADLSPLRLAVEKLLETDINSEVSIRARETLNSLDQRKSIKAKVKMETSL